MPWTKFLNHCIEKKTFYPNGEKVCSDPLKKGQNFDFENTRQLQNFYNENF